MMPHLFEQQPRESDKAFAAFQEYLRMGPQRSLAAVGVKLRKSVTLLGRWSAKFDWPARVQAYSGHLAEVERKMIEEMAIERAVEWMKLHEPTKRLAWKKAEEMIKRIDYFMAKWEEGGRVPGFESLVKGLELAFKLKQFAAGMSENRPDVTADVGPILVDFEAALKKVYARRKAAGVVVDVESKPVEPVALPPAK